MNKKKTAISINNISFSYNDKEVFKDFSATFAEGETTTIMSPSGKGKTTLLYLISRLLTTKAGDITYSISSPKFSMVFQDDRLIEASSVTNNIKLVNPDLNDNDISICLKALGLSGYSNKKVKHLSGGEKRRVAIARAILADFDILLMDEPFTGLDDDTKEIVISYIKKRTAGKTVLLITHNKSEAEKLNSVIFTI